MIDTVRLKLRMKLSPSLLVSPWRRFPTQHVDPITGELSESKVKYELVSGELGASIRYIYRPSDYQGNPLLYISISSFPKLVYGDELEVIHNLEEAIFRANLIVNSTPVLPGIDLGKGEIDYVDFVYDHHLGDQTDDYLEVITRLIHPHRTRIVYLNAERGIVRSAKDNGVLFSTESGNGLLRFYKRDESCGIPGILRQESGVSERTLRRITGIDRLIFREITPELAVHCLQNSLDAIGMNNTVITDKENALGILLKQYSSGKAMRLAEFVSFAGEHPESDTQQLAKALKYTPQAINKYKRQLTAAGIAPTTISSSRVLEPLTIDINRYNRFLKDQ